MVALGSTWVAILGYLMLESMGWRVFVLCTSIPLFVPPIALMHYVTYRDRSMVEYSKMVEDASEPIQYVVPNFKTRTLKARWALIKPLFA